MDNSKLQNIKNVRVLIVDDESDFRRILTDLIENLGYEVISAATPFEAMEIIKTERGLIDILIADKKMPQMEGHVLMTEVHEIDSSVVSILTTSYSNVENIVEAIRAGAFDYLPKPCRLETLDWVLQRASNHRTVLLENTRYREQMEYLVEERGQALEATRHHLEYSYQFMLESMVSLLEAREPLTGMHTKRVTRMAVVLGEAMGLEGVALENIRRGACLHDVGKIAIPDAILLKPGPLDKHEWKVMKTHVEIGFNLLISNTYMQDVAEIVHSHHEWYDGSGYPRGLKGQAICLGARIFAVIDAYDAIHSKRTYSEAISSEATVAEIERCSGTQFDPQVVACLVQHQQAVEDAWLEFAQSGSSLKEIEQN